MAGKPRASRRDEILATFVRHVAERGYERTNLADIADELGLAQGTIVYHFGSKAQMLRELEETYMQRHSAEVKEIWRRLSKPEDRVAAYVHAMVLLPVIDRDATVASQREVVQLAKDPAMRKIRKLRAELQAILRDEVQRGIDTRVFRPVDAEVAALQIFGSAQWMWTWFGPSTGTERVATTYVEIFLGGLLTDRGKLARLADPKGKAATVAAECLAAEAFAPA